MCGIVGFTSRNKSAVGPLVNGLRRLEYRGYDSAGVALESAEGIKIYKQTGKVAKLDNLLSRALPEGERGKYTIGIAHTRWATHGLPTVANAHPHVADGGSLALVHNGIIENYAALRAGLEKRGVKFLSQTDTEVVAHLVAAFDKGDFLAAAAEALKRVEGTYGIAAISARHPGEMVVARKGSPLVIGVGEDDIVVASDVSAIVAYTRQVIYLKDGDIARITPKGVDIHTLDNSPVTREVQEVDWDIGAIEKGGYEHFMLKEIMEQPAAVKAALSPRVHEGKIQLDGFDLTKEQLEGVNKIIITACGSAYYAGCSGRYAIEKLCRIPVQVELASELRYSDPMVDEHTLVLVISQSGETADTIAALKECKGRGATVLGIVNVVGSTIAKLADHTLYTFAGPEIAVATTKGFTTQLAVLYLFALYAAEKLGRVTPETYAALVRELQHLPRRIQQAIDMNYQLPTVASRYASRSLFFIGRNTDYAVALEGALKMKEISYLHAESYAAGELKHGTIALIEENQPVIAVCCNEALSDKTLSNIVEVKARGAKVLALAFKGNKKIVSQADDVIFIPRTETIFSACLAVVPLQLLAYYAAKEKGCDIDKPKNLAKSVTVE